MSKRFNNNIKENIEDKKIKLENKLTEEDINNISNNYIDYIQKLYNYYYNYYNTCEIIMKKIKIIDDFKNFILNKYKFIQLYTYDDITKYYSNYYKTFKQFIKIMNNQLKNLYEYKYIIKEFKKLIIIFSYENILNNWNYLKNIFIRLSLVYTYLYNKTHIIDYKVNDSLYILNIFIISL